MPKTHGMSGTPTHRTWLGMKTRCLNQKDARYHRYGGRGVKICDRWMLFENFIADMGERPAGTSIDRIDNDGNYEPGNCRWIPMSEQARNRGVVFRLNGEASWEIAQRLGFKLSTVSERLRKFKAGLIAEAEVYAPLNAMWREKLNAIIERKRAFRAFRDSLKEPSK